MTLGKEWSDVQGQARRHKPADPRKPLAMYALVKYAKWHMLTGEIVVAQTVRNWFMHRVGTPKGYVTSDYNMEELTRA